MKLFIGSEKALKKYIENDLVPVVLGYKERVSYMGQTFEANGSNGKISGSYTRMSTPQFLGQVDIIMP